MSAAKKSLNVAVVGMGGMGLPITRNIAFKSRGGVYLQVHSRSIAKAKKVCSDLSADGATCAMRVHNKYSTVTKWGDVVLTVLQDVNVARKVLLEDRESLIRNARAGQIIVDHTTVDAETSKECDFEARKRGAHFMDAPLCGSPKAVFNAQTTIYCGGSEEVFNKVSPILSMYAENLFRMGNVGAGSTTKGISQMLVAMHSVAAAEAMSMAHDQGVENTNKLIAALDASWGSSTMLRRSALEMEVMLRNPGDPAPFGATSCARLRHDVSLLGSGCATPLSKFPLLDTSLLVLDAAVNSGSGDRDVSSVVQHLGAAERTPKPPTPTAAPASQESPLEEEEDGECEFY